MGAIWSFYRVLAGNKRNLKLECIKKDGPEIAIKRLMLPEAMKGLYLGECLDSCRWGSMTTCMWPIDIKGFIGIIQKWREENNDNLNLYHEYPIGELYNKFELPHITHDSCPKDKTHKATLIDRIGMKRCSYVESKFIRPSFIVEYDKGFDAHSQTERKEFYEEKPYKPEYFYDDNGNEKYYTDQDKFEEYEILKEKFDNEEPNLEVLYPCYSIISDKNLTLPLETIFTRENVSRERGKVEFMFDGWDVAYYVQRWKEQSKDRKDPPLFSTRKDYCIHEQPARYIN